MTWSLSITGHYESRWGRCADGVRVPDGPIGDLGDQFQVLVFPSRAGRMMWTYATVGMSSPADSECIELHLFSPREEDGLIELLTAVAHYHRPGRPLGLWHTVNFGRPWIADSLCTHGFVSLPYLDGAELEWCQDRGTAVPIRCLWLIPVTADEVAFKKAHGAEALERRFEERSLEYANPSRDSVA